jgi:A/G-specific adenine glycosylase
VGAALSKAARATKRPARATAVGAKRKREKAPSLDAAALRTFGSRLRAWYRRNARDLPWRRTRDPYAILVSELMLQQTQVSRVLDFWRRFLDRFPTLHHLADAHEREVLNAWQGLGYYARARNLHKLSRAVVREGAAAWGDAPTSAAASSGASGALPNDAPHGIGSVPPVTTAADGTPSWLPAEAKKLRRLPGVGAYTAGAVSTFAFERRASLVDTNVARVLARVFAPKLNPKRPRDLTVLWQIAEATLPRTGKATWTHNQALMELGALVCTARVKRCGVCPVRSVCRSVEDA